jgi:UDP-N-acetyl-2-amino-2-deoxyglucuronate dehydrogenase
MIDFALIGCGRIGRRHAELLHGGSVNGARLVGVCDSDEHRVKTFSDRFKCPGFLTIHDLITQTRPTAVIVCTPSGNHAQHTIESSQHGVHVVVEKPMALALDDADQMILACAEARVKLFVVKQNRFNLPILKLRELIDSGRMGRLTLGTVRVRWCRTDDYYQQDPWRGTWTHDGGVLANQASHHIDALEWMMGSVDSVYAIAQTALASVEVEDTALALLRFRSGALGVIEATTAARPNDIEGSLSVLGEYGTVEVAGKSLNRIRTWQLAGEDSVDSLALESFSENPPDIYGFGHLRYLEHVVDCVVNDSQQLVDGFEGRKSLELINAIYESIETSKEVSLRFVPKHSRLGVQGGT